MTKTLLIDPSNRSVREAEPHPDLLPQAVLENGVEVFASSTPLPNDGAFLVEGHPKPFVGEGALLLPPGLTLDWVLEHLDFGHVVEAGSVSLFIGDRHIREI